MGTVLFGRRRRIRFTVLPERLIDVRGTACQLLHVTAQIFWNVVLVKMCAKQRDREIERKRDSNRIDRSINMKNPHYIFPFLHIRLLSFAAGWALCGFTHVCVFTFISH